MATPRESLAFTDHARAAMRLANQEAHRFNHEYVGTEHILLGLIKLGHGADGVAMVVLQNLKLDLRVIRGEVEKLVTTKQGVVPPAKLPQTPRAKKVIEFAMEEAEQFGHNYVGTEHFLLGLLREGEGVAGQVLYNLGLRLEDVREEVANILGRVLSPEEVLAARQAERAAGPPPIPKEPPFLHSSTELTPASMRALWAARIWTSGGEAVDVPELLLGLLAESDCRAALILARHGIDPDRVLRRFTNIQESPIGSERKGVSPGVAACFVAAEERLIEYPRPIILATEHLLLGIVASDHAVSRWLRECGLDPIVLELEVHRLAGHQPGPLAIPGEATSSFSSPVTHVEAEPTAAQEIGVLRIVDAAANRAGEGLRVIEDYLRFVLDDAFLTSECKNLRHDLTEALGGFATSDRHAARETREDVGTQITNEGEQARATPESLLVANFKRVQQSLRSLEESAKLLLPERAQTLEALRYRTYTLERSVDITRTSLETLEHVRLYVLVDGNKSKGDFDALVQSLVSAGVGAIQLRDKQLDDRTLLERARRLRMLTKGTKTLFIMNDRPDLAVLSGADGVHVGQEELSVKDTRRIVGSRMLVGVSTHSLEQARQAVLDGANYIGVGPTFPSGTKEFKEFPGLELLTQVGSEIRLPAFAIGGINTENLSQVLAAGFTRVAVSGAITSASDPAAVASKLLTALLSAPPG